MIASQHCSQHICNLSGTTDKSFHMGSLSANACSGVAAPCSVRIFTAQLESRESTRNEKCLRNRNHREQTDAPIPNRIESAIPEPLVLGHDKLSPRHCFTSSLCSVPDSRRMQRQTLEEGSVRTTEGGVVVRQKGFQRRCTQRGGGRGL